MQARKLSTTTTCKAQKYSLIAEAAELSEVTYLLVMTPELYLRRPPAYYPEWRLDRLLKRKAEQGVKIYVVVYKEVTETMTLSSKHTKVRNTSAIIFIRKGYAHKRPSTLWKSSTKILP